GRRRWNLRRAELGLQVLRRDAEQDAQLVQTQAQADLQLRDLCLRLRQEAAGLPRVHARLDLELHAGFDLLQGLCLQSRVLPGVLDALLEGAYLDIVRGHIAQQRDQHVVVVIDGGVQVGAGRFNGAAEAAPEVELPGEIEPEVPLTEEALAD